MLNKVLPIIIVLAAVGGSGFAAMTLRGGSGPEAEESTSNTKKAAAHGEVRPVEKDEGAADVGGFFKFQRSFIVPVTSGKVVDSLILLSLNIEISDGDTESFRTKEPKLRDAFMKALLNLSYEGKFDTQITDPAVYTAIQEDLTAAAQSIIGQAAQNVLIIDFAKQNQ